MNLEVVFQSAIKQATIEWLSTNAQAPAHWDWLTEEQACALLDISPQTLRKYFIDAQTRTGDKIIHYSKKKISEIMERRSRREHNDDIAQYFK